MDNDGTSTTPPVPVQTPAAPTVVASPPAATTTPPPTETAPPAPVTLASLLASGETVNVADLTPLLEQEQAATVARVEADIRQRANDERARQQAQDQQNAAAASDIEWAQTVYDQMDDADPAVSEAAKVAMRTNELRFNRGRALKYQRESSEAQQTAVQEYMTPLWAGVRAAGYEALFVAGGALNNGESQAMRDANGNWMLAAMKSAEAIGYERGKTEAGNAADLNNRVNEASGGPPALGAPSADANADLWNGIDRSKPGAAAEYQRRLADRQRAIPGR